MVIVIIRVHWIILRLLIKYIIFTLLNWWQVFCAHTLRGSRTEQDKGGFKQSTLIGHIIIDNLHLLVLYADKVSDSSHKMSSWRLALVLSLPVRLSPFKVFERKIIFEMLFFRGTRGIFGYFLDD